MPGYPSRRRGGLGYLAPTDVPGRLRPWVDNSPAQYQGPDVPLTNARFLREKAAEAEALFKSIGGRTAANPHAIPYDPASAPWVVPPPGYEPFFAPGIINTPNATNTDVTVFTLFGGPVPQGWDGVIQQIACFYTGPGFIAGAGLLTWRITRNGQPLKTFDAIQVALGTYTQQGGVQPFPLAQPIRIFAGDVVKFIVNHAAPGLSTNGTQIITFLGGFIYPNQGAQ